VGMALGFVIPSRRQMVRRRPAKSGRPPDCWHLAENLTRPHGGRISAFAGLWSLRPHVKALGLPRAMNPLSLGADSSTHSARTERSALRTDFPCRTPSSPVPVKDVTIRGMVVRHVN